MSNKLMITVDVEAQPGRAERDHVKRLIWGEYPEGGKGGIGEMMDIADRHGAPIVMFVDYCERALYGDEILDVAREVHRRGHDLQLHSHPEFLPPTFWSKRGLAAPAVMNDANDAQADALLDYLCESQALSGGDKPQGYRGGGYRYGAAVLRALVRHGIMLDSSYIAARENQPLRRGRLRQFRWDNGCLEVPVSCINPFLNLTRDFDLNFNASAFSSAERMLQCLKAFYSQQGNDAIAVMVLHSWSFSRRQENGYFSPPIPDYVERFDAFLSLLTPNDIQVISTNEALCLAQTGSVGLGLSIALQELEAAQGSAGRPEPKKVAAAELPSSVVSVPAQIRPSLAAVPAGEALSCSVCSAPVAAFEDYNGRNTSRCTICGAVERHRVFVDVYDSFLRREFNLVGKRVLALSPSQVELMIFAQRSISVVSCDIQPTFKADIVADITSMPQVASATFDCVIASYVLTCVHNLDAALGEVARVLRPGGRFLFCDPLEFNADTKEHKNIATITNYYGEEAYEKYKIGSFRRLGDLGILRKLAEHGFLTKTLYGRDQVTDSVWVWHAASKSPSLEFMSNTAIPCAICGTDLAGLAMVSEQNCPKCGARPRTRTLPAVVCEDVKPLIAGAGPLLAFAMTSTEEQIIRPVFPEIISVSLYGKYRSDHLEGVDVRDLSRFADGQFVAITGVLLFDYVPEMDSALAECFRVLADGGVLFTHIAGERLVDGLQPPTAIGVIEKRTGYFDYVPSDANMPSVRVGREWFIEAMGRAGFDARHVRIEDRPTGTWHDWFVGVKQQATPKVLPNPGIVKKLGATQLRPRTVREIQPVKRDAASITVPLPPETGASQITLSVDAYDFGPDFRASIKFAEHVVDETGAATLEVVCVTDDAVLVSQDLGASWLARTYDDSVPLQFWNTFTPAGGPYRILQCRGWEAEHDKRKEGPDCGRLYLMDQDGDLVAAGECGTAAWHGSHSIDARSGTIIYGEYHTNSLHFRNLKLREPMVSEAEAKQFVRDNSLFRSTDGGLTWMTVLTLGWGEARHFHVVRADPFLPGVWWASTGDMPTECRVFRSDDDGRTWREVTNPDPSIPAPPSQIRARQASQRTTSLLFTQDDIRWGADDLFGPVASFRSDIDLTRRSGARLYMSGRSDPLQPVELGYCGHPVRSAVDVGLGYVLFTEAYYKWNGASLEPQVLFWSKSSPECIVPLMSVKNLTDAPTGFTYSRASRAACDGTFFTYRSPNIVFKGTERFLKWAVTFA